MPRSISSIRHLTFHGPQSIIGRGLVIHEKADDYSQPVGNAGGRVAVGVIGVAPRPEVRFLGGFAVVLCDFIVGAIDGLRAFLAPAFPARVCHEPRWKWCLARLGTLIATVGQDRLPEHVLVRSTMGSYSVS